MAGAGVGQRQREVVSRAGPTGREEDVPVTTEIILKLQPKFCCSDMVARLTLGPGGR
jgi:hypothetical protein